MGLVPINFGACY